MAGGTYLWDHIGDAPALLAPCLKKREMPPRDALPEAVAARYDAHLAYQEQIRGSSIYPAVQNIILACRALGLGTLITTNHILYEDEVRAILGPPPRRLHLCPDADRLPAREIRSAGAPPCFRSHLRLALGRKVARHLTKLAPLSARGRS